MTPNIYPPAIQRAVLEAVAETLAHPDHWLQGDYSVDAEGRRVTYGSPNACRHCLVNAVLLACQGRAPTDATLGSLAAVVGRALGEQLELDYGPGLFLTVWQDAPERQHAEVLTLVRRTISHLEE